MTWQKNCQWRFENTGGLDGADELLADLYTFGDAQIRDPQKAAVKLESLDKQEQDLDF